LFGHRIFKDTHLFKSSYFEFLFKFFSSILKKTSTKKEIKIKKIKIIIKFVNSILRFLFAIKGIIDIANADKDALKRFLGIFILIYIYF